MSNEKANIISKIDEILTIKTLSEKEIEKYKDFKTLLESRPFVYIKADKFSLEIDSNNIANSQIRNIDKNPRHIQNLKDSIEAKGEIIEPILVFEKRDNPNVKVVINGVHRTKAFQSMIEEKEKKYKDFFEKRKLKRKNIEYNENYIPSFVLKYHEKGKFDDVLNKIQLGLNDHPPSLACNTSDIKEFIKIEIRTFLEKLGYNRQNFDQGIIKYYDKGKAERVQLERFTQALYKNTRSERSIKSLITKAINELGQHVGKITHNNSEDWLKLFYSNIKNVSCKDQKSYEIKNYLKSKISNSNENKDVTFLAKKTFVNEKGSSFDQKIWRSFKEMKKLSKQNNVEHVYWMFASMNATDKMQLQKCRESFLLKLKEVFDLAGKDFFNIAIPKYIIIAQQSDNKTNDVLSWQIISKSELIQNNFSIYMLK